MKRAFILAAGRGERLKPLTDTTPKPLIDIGSKKLIEHQLTNLKKAGITEVIINVSWLRQQIMDVLGDGANYGINIKYSNEGDNALETAGGIINALPLLGDEPFIVINGDIYSDIDLNNVKQVIVTSLAHLILIENPNHNQKGDFSIQDNVVCNVGEPRYTYSGIGIYTKEFFDNLVIGKISLTPLLREKCDQKLVTGEIHKGHWFDIGTRSRLEELQKWLSN